MDEISKISKKNAGKEAAKFVKDGSVLGLGTGSTVKYFIEALSERIKKEELDIIGIPTSIETEKLSESLGIKISSLEEHPNIDLDVDGADQVDENFCLIKGYGGALTREKIVAFASEKFICIIDELKLSRNLNKPIPVEFIPFAKGFVEVELKKIGGICELRKQSIDPQAILKTKFLKALNERESEMKRSETKRSLLSPAGSSMLELSKTVKASTAREMTEGSEMIAKKRDFITDNKNFILDTSFNTINEPYSLEKRLNEIAGVVENGIFAVRRPETVIVGNEKGAVIQKK